MKNLLFFGYYGFRDGYFAYGKYLKKKFDNFSFFPLLELRDKLNLENININDIEMCINGKFLTNKNYSNELIYTRCQYNYILIAHNNDFLQNFYLGKINFFHFLLELKKKYNFKLIQINWDPDDKNYNNFKMIKNFDIGFYSNPKYLTYDNIKYFQQGYCEKTSFYKEIDNYKCDVSFIGTNLYTETSWENQNLNRKKILDIIYNETNIKLHIYGSDFLKNIYPKSYKGFINYEDCYKVFSNSLINLNISPLNDIKYEKNGKKYYYYSERMPQIIACNGIMMSNNDYEDFLKKNDEYILIENLDKIIDIIYEFKNNKIKVENMKKNIEKKKNNFNYKNIYFNF